MTRILNASRILVAAISLVAIVGAPFVIMNTKPAPIEAGYGVPGVQMDRAQANDKNVNV